MGKGRHATIRDAEREGRNEMGRGGREGKQVGKKAARQEGAKKRKNEPNVRGDLCLPISAASRK